MVTVSLSSGTSSDIFIPPRGGVLLGVECDIQMRSTTHSPTPVLPRRGEPFSHSLCGNTSLSLKAFGVLSFF